jgi:hypothetical protein
MRKLIVMGEATPLGKSFPGEDRQKEEKPADVRLISGC